MSAAPAKVPAGLELAPRLAGHGRYCEECERPVEVDVYGRCERCHAAEVCDTCGGEGELLAEYDEPIGSIRLTPRSEMVPCHDCGEEWEAA